VEGKNMQCPECQFENPEDSAFCGDCGALLEMSCPNCGSTPPPGFKFCNKCGHDLRNPSEELPIDLSFDQKIEKIQKYLPKGITEKILSQRDRIEGERKHVTVMFCDLQGFTALSEQLGAEDAYGIMDDVYELLIHKVHDYEGTVNEMTGDGIMALFGAPIALEDASQRAIRSSLAIHREISKFSNGLEQRKKIESSLKMRIGIHTGPVVVGTLGNDLRVEFKAVGDTVNLASRMESLAKPGTTYVTDATYRQTEGFFLFEALGEKDIKGKQGSVKTYQVIGPSTRRTRFDVSADRGLTPLVGRERELELLLDSFERAKAGRGQAVSIVAEAGIGKSRLLYEFRKAVSSEDVTFLEGRCLSYSRGVAFYSIDILKANFDIREGDRDLEIKKKIKKGIKIVRADEASTFPYLLDLFSIKEGGTDKFSMSPEGKKNQIMESVKRITLKGAEIRPLILANEDLHWMDKSSEDFLKNVLESIPGARILMIFTYRPEFVPTWGAKSYHSQVTLNRLSNRESLAMVTNLLGTEEIDRNLEDLILEKTEGIPFFIEEFIKSLKDLKIIETKDNKYYLAKDTQEVSLPSTIQDVIMARVDSLPEGSKVLIQIGSVIEREFGYELIKKVSGLAEKRLLSYLSALKESELLYEKGIYPETIYIFKHALTREVVYDSIISKRKKKLHGEIGNAIVEVYGKNNVEYYEVLAEHFITSEDFEKGAEYSRLAGKKAEKTASFVDALAYGEKRIACLEKLPAAADVQKKIVDARTILGLYSLQLNWPVTAKEAIDPIIDTAIRISNNRRLSQIFTIIGAYELEVEEDFLKAIDYFEKALKMSRDEKDRLSLFFGNYFLGLAYFWNCQYEKALRHYEKCLEMNVSTNNLWGISAMKTFISWLHLQQGNIDHGHQISNEALQMAEESGDIYSRSIAYINYGYACLCLGDLTKAKQFVSKGNLLSEKIKFFIWNVFANSYLGEIYFQTKEFENSKNCFKEAVMYLQKAGFGHSRINFCRMGIARAKTMDNEIDIDLDSLHSYVHGNKIKELNGQMSKYIGEILLNLNDQDFIESEKFIANAIEADKRNGMKWHLGRDYAFYAELFKRKGDLAKAKEKLNKATGILQECGADGWVEKYGKDLAEL
jgi:predicted ATPase/class 3 adenylate cyclase